MVRKPVSYLQGQHTEKASKQKSNYRQNDPKIRLHCSPNMQLHCPTRGRVRAVSTDPTSCCVITVHTICIMGTSQVFTNKHTFFLILLAGVASDVSVLSYIFKHSLRQETRFVSQMFRVQTSITHRLSSFPSGKCQGSVFN